MAENRYVVKFSKNGYVKYTSHLDLLRVFKRAFKRSGIDLVYSQGFNPHPKMSFAQPLSLGYSSNCELIEFETVRIESEDEIIKKLSSALPLGIQVLSCTRFTANTKALAGECDAAGYQIIIPTELDENELKSILNQYFLQKNIVVSKRQKKSKDLKEIDIKPMIREITVSKVEDNAVLDCLLDSGSQSNLSPELVISSFLEYSEIPTERYEIEVERKEILFKNDIKF